MKRKRIIALFLSIFMTTSFVDIGMLNKAYAITYTQKILSNTDTSKNTTKEVTVQTELKAVKSKNDDAFPKTYEYSDAENYSGTIPRATVDWKTNPHTETSLKQTTKTYTVTDKDAVPKTIAEQATIDGNLYSGNIPLKDVVYEVTKTKQVPVYRTETQEFSKTMTKEHQNSNNNSLFPETYTINENGYSGTIPRTDVQWTGEGTTLYMDATDSKTNSADQFDDKVFVERNGYSGYIEKDGGSTLISGSYTPSDTKNVTFPVTSETNNFSDTYWYNRNGYYGLLNKTGSVSYERLTLERFITDYATGNPATFLFSLFKYVDGYSGFIGKSGEPYVYSGSPAGTVTLTETVEGVKPVSIIIDSKDVTVDGGSASTSLVKGEPGDSGDAEGCKATIQSKNMKSKGWTYGDVYQYSQNGYTGTLYVTYETTFTSAVSQEEYARNPNGTFHIAGTTRRIFKGMVTKSSTQVKSWELPNTVQKYYNGQWYTLTKVGSPTFVRTATLPTVYAKTSFGYKYATMKDKTLDYVCSQTTAEFDADIKRFQTVPYSENGYTAEWKFDGYDYSGGYRPNFFPVLAGDGHWVYGWTMTAFKFKADPKKDIYRQQYAATITTPDTRVWRQNYAGTITKQVDQYTQNYTGEVFKPAVDTRVWKQNYKGKISKSIGDYNGVATYSGTLSKQVFDHYETVPVEWKATAVYEGNLSYYWEDYDGTATYSGEVSELEAFIDANDDRVTSSLKENRKAIITLTNSVSKYPIDNSKTKLEITPLTSGITDNDIKAQFNSNTAEVVFKKPGDYKIIATISNGKVTVSKEKTITIIPDDKPVANFSTRDVIYRDPMDNNKATINLEDNSSSLDNDTIAQRIWKYKFDANNNGSFADDVWVTIDSGNNTKPSLKVDKVGKYLIELEVREEFGQPTIAGFVTTGDRKTANTDSKPISEKVVEVDNIRPSATFMPTQKQKADVVFTIGNVPESKKTDLNNKINAYIKSKLEANNISANIQTLQTTGQNMQNSFTWNKDVSSSVGQIYFQNNGTKIQMYGNTSYAGFNKIYTSNNQDTEISKQEMTFSYTLDYGDSFDGAGVLLNTHVENGLMNGYAVFLPNYGSVTVYQITNWSSSTGQDIKTSPNAKAIGTVSMARSGTYTLRTTTNKLTVIQNGQEISSVNLPQHYGWGFGFFSDHYAHGCDSIGQFSLDNIKLEVTKGKSFDQVIKEPNWNQNAGHFLVNINDGLLLGQEDNPNPNLLTLANSIFNASHSWSAFNWQGSYSYLTTSSGGYNGNNYLKIYGTGYGDSGANIYVPVKPNTEYEFSSFINIPYSGTMFSNNFIAIVNQSNSSIIQSMIPSTGAAATSGWVPISGTFNSGNNNYIYIRVNRGDLREVWITDIKLREKSSAPSADDKEASILANLLSNNIYFAGLGNNTNKSEMESFINKNSGNGVFFDNSNMDTALSQLGDYIVNIILSKEQNPRYILLGEGTSYNITYFDYENDPQINTQWQYSHDANYFDNSLGEASYNNKWLNSTIDSFDKVGKFDVFVKVQDNPVGTMTGFDGYKKWSDEKLDKQTIYVHRKPIAEFTASVKRNLANNNFDVFVSEDSYDLDHTSKSNKGIVEKQWKWKNAESTTWNIGMPPASLPANNNYIVQLLVKDEEGAWSDPKAQFITTKNVNIAPVALFTVSPDPLPLSKTMTITDKSYDPNGDTIASRHWTMFKNGAKVFDSYTMPTTTDIVKNGVGSYKITLVVRDNPQYGLPLDSEPYSQEFKVIADNRKPVANFTVSPNPVPTDVNVAYTENSTDPDNDPIVQREWRVKKTTEPESAWKTYSTPPVNFESFGTGIVQIQLRVKDQPVLPQLDALWSDWYEQRLTVIAGNQKPIARFNPSPNPVPADEPVNYNDTSYDPEGKPLVEKIWTVYNRETGAKYEFYNQQPPTVFEGTGWGANGDGVGTYDITLKVKDTTPNGLSPARWSDEVKQTLVVEDPLRITALSMISIVNPPQGTVAPINYPVITPTKIKAGYKMTFKVNTNGGDKIDIKLYANGIPLNVHTDSGDTNTINKSTIRKNASTTFDFWSDKDLPKDTVIDMKIVLTKTKMDGSSKSLVNSDLGNHFGIVVGSSKEDSSINLTE